MILTSSKLDPFFHLGVESALLDTPPVDEPILYLWQSTETVVIGKHQNPWLECNFKAMEEDGITLARRVSGGGAVYHDAGNLNFCIQVARDTYRREETAQVVLDALKAVHVRADMPDASSICVGGMKVSGNAYCLRRNRAMHHGTILVKSDLPRLNSYLTLPIMNIQTHAVRSHAARVFNVSSIYPSATVDRMKEEMIKAFATYTGKEEEPVDVDTVIGELELPRLSNWEWVIGQTPRFEYRHQSKRAQVHKGVIVGATEWKVPMSKIVGRRFEPELVQQAEPDPEA